MRKMIIGAAACASVLLAGYGCAFADDASNKTKDNSETQTVVFKTVDRVSGYAIPDYPTSKYFVLIAKYAKEYDVPVELAHAVVRVESNFNPNARGRAGEIGLMQIKPATARMMGYSGTKEEL